MQLYSRSRVFRFFIKFFGTAGYTGFFPFAPGTAGSFVGFVIFWLVSLESLIYYIIFVIFVMLLGVFCAGLLEQEWGTDSSKIVIDEVIGMGISLIAVPPILGVWILTFLLFRIFDIWKPFPIRQTEKISGGWGVVLDDVLAGIYACVLVHGIWWIRSQF